MSDQDPGPPEAPDIHGGGVTITPGGGVSPFVWGPGGSTESPDSPTQSGPTHYNHLHPADGPLPGLPEEPVAPPQAEPEEPVEPAQVTWGYTEPEQEPDTGYYQPPPISDEIEGAPDPYGDPYGNSYGEEY